MEKKVFVFKGSPCRRCSEPRRDKKAGICTDCFDLHVAETRLNWRRIRNAHKLEAI